MSKRIEYADLSEILLDSLNPRLGSAAQDLELTQEEIYERMVNWSLEELATSFLESGFWEHEAVLCIRDESDGDERLVVIEGNRRIAALMRLKKTYEKEERSPKWLRLIDGVDEPLGLFDKIPYIRISERREVASFLGFRHVTGIKEWRPPEKAAFIASLLNEEGVSYRDVMRRIGSKTPVVERNYVAYCIFTQMKEIEDLDASQVEDRFSVLFLSLRSTRVRRFLGVENKFGIDPAEVPPPVDDEHLDQLREYSLWLFGDGENLPIVQDSRQVDKFARVLASEHGLAYLRAVPRPDLETAFIIAGGDEEEVFDLVKTATFSLEDALKSIHLYKSDEKLIAMVRRLIAHTDQIRKTLGIP